MRRIHMRLFASTLRPDSRAHEGLGLSAKQPGMKHTETTNMILQAADPFDRSFVDEMVPHHEGQSEWPMSS